MSRTNLLTGGFIFVKKRNWSNLLFSNYTSLCSFHKHLHAKHILSCPHTSNHYEVTKPSTVLSPLHSSKNSSFLGSIFTVPSCYTHSTTESGVLWKYLDSGDDEVIKTLSEDMIVVKDFISKVEEQSILEEVERYMKRLRYEYDHWDNAIHGFRETEKKSWNAPNTEIIQRVKDLAFPSDVLPIAYVHVLDIAKEGYIKPHVDAVRFCGDTITGMSLLSSCVMRLALENDTARYADVYLPQRSLYIMKNKARFDYTHEVLKAEESSFMGEPVPRDRRVSVICRNEPDPQHHD